MDFHTIVNNQDGESRGSSDSEGELFSSSSAAEGRQSLPTRRLSTSLIVSQFRRPVQPRSVSGRAGQRIHPGLLWRDGEWGLIKYIKDQDLNLLLLSSTDLLFVTVCIQLLCNMKLCYSILWRFKF